MEFIEFIGFVLAIIAIAIALQLRTRLAELDRRVSEISGRMALPGVPMPTTAPETPPPLDLPAATPVAPQPAERVDEAAIGRIIDEAAVPPPPPPPLRLEQAMN